MLFIFIILFFCFNFEDRDKMINFVSSSLLSHSFTIIFPSNRTVATSLAIVSFSTKHFSIPIVTMCLIHELRVIARLRTLPSGTVIASHSLGSILSSVKRRNYISNLTIIRIVRKSLNNFSLINFSSPQLHQTYLP